MFYDRFSELCKESGVSPSAVMVAIGLNKSNATFWKKGSIPKGDTLQKLADYFGVSVDYLLGNVNKPYLYVDVQKSARAMGFKPDGPSLPEPRISAALEQLNDAGKEKAADAVELIAQIPQYRRTAIPQPPPAPPEGKDTTPTAKPTEEPQEGG